MQKPFPPQQEIADKLRTCGAFSCRTLCRQTKKWVSRLGWDDSQNGQSFADWRRGWRTVQVVGRGGSFFRGLDPGAERRRAEGQSAGNEEGGISPIG